MQSLCARLQARSGPARGGAGFSVTFSAGGRDARRSHPISHCRRQRAAGEEKFGERAKHSFSFIFHSFHVSITPKHAVLCTDTAGVAHTRPHTSHAMEGLIGRDSPWTRTLSIERLNWRCTGSHLNGEWVSSPFAAICGRPATCSQVDIDAKLSGRLNHLLNFRCVPRSMQLQQMRHSSLQHLRIKLRWRTS